MTNVHSLYGFLYTTWNRVLQKNKKKKTKNHINWTIRSFIRLKIAFIDNLTIYSNSHYISWPFTQTPMEKKEKKQNKQRLIKSVCSCSHQRVGSQSQIICNWHTTNWLFFGFVWRIGWLKSDEGRHVDNHFVHLTNRSLNSVFFFLCGKLNIRHAESQILVARPAVRWSWASRQTAGTWICQSNQPHP